MPPSPVGSPDLTDNLERNLRALMVQARTLVKRLLLPGAKDHLRTVDGGELQILMRGAWQNLSHGQAEIETRLAEIAGSRKILLFGVGSGDGLAHLLATLPDARVYAWDRDPHLLRTALERHDFEAALATGRLRFGMGVDLLAQLNCDSIGDIVEHPTLAKVYGDERHILHFGRNGGPRVLLDCRDEDAAELGGAFRHADCEVWPMDVQRLSAEEIDHHLEAYQPDQVLALHWREHLMQACPSRKISLTLWELESGAERTSSYARPAVDLPIFCSSPPRADTFTNAGFERVTVLPRAIAAPSYQAPAAQPGERAPLCFIGSSLVERAMAGRRNFVELYTSWRQAGSGTAGECDHLLQSVLDAQRSNYSEYSIPQLLPQYFGEFLAAAERSQIPEDLVRQIGDIAAAEKRLGYVADLGSLGIEVWGDEHWRQAESYGIDYRGMLHGKRRRAELYASPAIHVDVPVLSTPGQLSPILLHTLAAGGFLITEHSRAIAEAFEVGEELITYGNQAQLHAIIEHYLAHPDEARAIAKQGQARVLADHTWAARLPKLWEAWNVGVPT